MQTTKKPLRERFPLVILAAGMAYNNQPPTAATPAMAMVLAKQQQPKGNWAFTMPREPMQSSFFTLTALSVRSLQAYAPRSASAEIQDRLARANAWLERAPTKDNEDRAFRLLGMFWSGSSKEARLAAAKDVLAHQRADGGWAQVEGRASDAYATGQALYALAKGAGRTTNDPSFRRGIDYLLRTQDRDGTWFVNKRAMPANNYLDTGFPHGESQYSSFNGTSWAMMALPQSMAGRQRDGDLGEDKALALSLRFEAPSPCGRGKGEGSRPPTTPPKRAPSKGRGTYRNSLIRFSSIS